MEFGSGVRRRLGRGPDGGDERITEGFGENEHKFELFLIFHFLSDPVCKETGVMR
jgi:hypothetical protein